MSSFAGTYLVYALLALPAAAASAWALYRWSGPLVLDAFDADELLTAAVHRLVSGAYALFAIGVALALGPRPSALHPGTFRSVTAAWAGLLILLGLFHLGALVIFGRVRAAQRNRDLGPPRWYAGPTSVPGAPQPMFSAPPPFLPPPSLPPSFMPPQSAPLPPAFVAGPPLAPPPPWWCSPVPLSSDGWAPPPR